MNKMTRTDYAYFCKLNNYTMLIFVLYISYLSHKKGIES
jgi:hypothetical protein